MKAYSWANVILLVNGIPIQGFDEGDDVFKGARTKDSAQDKVGVDGEMTVSYTQDKSGTITIRLLQSSDSNAFLSGIVNAAENGVFTPIAVMLRNVVTQETAGGSQGYIKRIPDISRGENATSQEWMIRLERYDLIQPVLEG